MTSVAVPVKIGVVLVQLDYGLPELPVAAASRPLDNTLPGTVLSHQLFQRSAFGRRIFRMRMIIVKTGAVRKNEVAFHVVERKWAMRVQAGKLILFFVLRQARHAKTPSILVR